MILLLGGTAETAPAAQALARAGYRVLVSKATDVPLDFGAHPNIEARSGPLNDDGLIALVRRRAIRAIVDVAHPYAVAIHSRAARAAELTGIPCLVVTRPSCVDPMSQNVEFVPDHAAAAAAAFRDGRPVLVTTGSRNLVPYVREARRKGVPLAVRVLDEEASKQACLAAGLSGHEILSGRGPFSVETNRHQIRHFGIGVLVTKDSGPAGGTAEKLAAAEMEGCKVIVVERPASAREFPVAHIPALLERLREALESSSNRTRSQCRQSPSNDAQQILSQDGSSQ